MAQEMLGLQYCFWYFPPNAPSLVFQGKFNLYFFPCILEMVIVYFFLKELDKNIREVDMQLEDRTMSYEVFTMLGANADKTIISINDGNMFQRLTGMYANMTKIKE
jgi:hypothetical protein